MANPGAIFGLVVGALGILYGWKAKHFKSDFFGLTSRPAEKVAPRGQDRLLVIAIAAIVFVASLVTLIANR